MAQIVDYYSESNQNNSTYLSTLYFNAFQSFTGDGGVLNSVKFYLLASGSPTCSGYAKIYSETHATAFGTDSVPNSLLATSEAVDVSTIGGSYSLITFTFSGDEKIELVDGTNYCVVFNCESLTGGMRIDSGTDSSTPTHSGNSGYSDPAWKTYANADLCFYVYRDEMSSVSPSQSPSLSPSLSQSPSNSPSQSYSLSPSQSPSLSPSSSQSPSQSPSISPSSSYSPSSSESSSNSPSPSPMITDAPRVKIRVPKMIPQIRITK